MLVDDEKFDHIAYKRLIDRSGLVEQTLSFQYARDALNFLKQEDREPVDVIFLDINMPAMNGFEFLDAARTDLQDNLAETAVILMTTSLNPADRDRADTYGAIKAYYAKPLDIAHLEAAADLVKAGTQAP